jgi:hypothetical protein
MFVSVGSVCYVDDLADDLNNLIGWRLAKASSSARPCELQ